jgi:opacity protein-like surface antigen
LKKIFVFLLILLILLFSAVVTLAEITPATDSTWEISLQGWDCRGTFDYYLYDSTASQMVSKVSFPQDQRMLITNLKYTLPNNYGYLKMHYGRSGTGLKGRGSDSDWATVGSSALTDYGELDAYGSQQLYAIDFGKTIIKNESHSTSILAGWGKKETTNELKNVVYYLIDGSSKNGLTQDDNGSTFDGELSGFYLGITDNMVIGEKITLTTELAVSFLHVKAYGRWNNHSPAWKWTDTGDTIGYTANIGLKYKLRCNVAAELGYYFSYAKATDCEEVLNDVLLSQPVDLEYRQKGFYLGLNFVL